MDLMMLLMMLMAEIALVTFMLHLSERTTYKLLIRLSVYFFV